MEEKEYSFIVESTGKNDIRNIGNGMAKLIVKESKLVQWQKDLLLGEAIKAYDNLTDELQMKFIQEINKR